MTVTSDTARTETTGDGVTTVFPYAFRILDQAHISVYVGGVLKTLTTDYSVSDVGEPGGGNITFVVEVGHDETPALDAEIVFARNVPYTQETDFINGGTLDENTLEDALDKLTMMIQQLEDTVGSAIADVLTGADAPTAAEGRAYLDVYSTAQGDARYVLMNGRTSGQSVYGGTAASENLTLISTYHATKGKVIFGAAGTFDFDTTKKFMGIGVASPGSHLDVLVGTLTNLSDRTLYGQGATTKVGNFFQSPTILTATRFHTLSSQVISGDSASAGQVAIYAAAKGTTAGANIWALNPLVQIDAGMTNGAALGIEVDVNNYGWDATQANPIWGVEVSGVQGVGVLRGYAGLGIAGGSWKYGLGFFNNSLDGGDAYIIGGDTNPPAVGIDFRAAVFGTAALVLANTDGISWTNSSAAVKKLIHFTSGNELVIGNDLAAGKLYVNIDGTNKLLSIDGSGFVKAT